MRQIKFRAWHKKEKKMWVVLEIDFNRQLITGGVKVHIHKGTIVNIRVAKFKDVELIQYTGLRDKKKKSIYEGDIIKHEPTNVIEKGEVRYIDKLGAYVIHPSFAPVAGAMDEVLGNIYEDKKLLK